MYPVITLGRSLKNQEDMEELITLWKSEMEKGMYPRKMKDMSRFLGNIAIVRKKFRMKLEPSIVTLLKDKILELIVLWKENEEIDTKIGFEICHSMHILGMRNSKMVNTTLY